MCTTVFDQRDQRFTKAKVIISLLQFGESFEIRHKCKVPIRSLVYPKVADVRF